MGVRNHILLRCMTSMARNFLAAPLLVLASATLCQCRPVTTGAGSASARAVGPKLAARSSSPEASQPVHRLRPRPWHLQSDSPFNLVAEGLRTAYPIVLDQTTLILSTPCSARPSPVRLPTTSIRVVHGDTFAANALPDAPMPVGRTTETATPVGHWPADVWVQFDFEREDPRPSRQYVHWTGARWQPLEAKPFDTADLEDAEDKLEPIMLFDWYDGAKLVARTAHWWYSAKYLVEPFLVSGRTSHPPPDFSKLPFSIPSKQFAYTSVTYAALPTHELFVAFATQSSVSIARTTESGDMRQETVAGGENIRFSSGRLNHKDVVVAWGSRGADLWLRAYDRVSSVQLPTPGPVRAALGDLNDVWFAGDWLWANRNSVIWRFDGRAWSKFATTKKGTEVRAVPEDGTLWGHLDNEVMYFDQDGNEHPIPFLLDAKALIAISAILPAARDDIWITATTNDPDQNMETLIFRTKKMKSILSCDAGPAN